MRLFLALDLPAELKLQLTERATAMRSSLPKARWVRPETLHLTLAFLGDIEPRLVERIDRPLEALCASSGRVEARLGAGGAFPPRGKGSVLWTHFEAGPELASLHRRIETALESIEGEGDPIYARESRPFRPHITLARCRQPWPRPAVARWIAAFGDPGLAVTIGEVTLFESRLSPSGPTYRAISRYGLSGGR